MTEIHAERRTFLQTAGGALALTAIATGAQAQSSPAAAPNRSPSMTFSPKPLPFDLQKVKGLSERILVSHYENN
jgi:Fe-Mn family superoxide dismutase